jgi:uncharacterized membrane protein
MAVETGFLAALAAMAGTAYASRVAGFLLMGYVRITPRVEAALKAMPLGVMIGLVMPAVAAGKLPELIALAVVGIVMKLVRNDLVAALAGAATIALCRWLLPA